MVKEKGEARRYSSTDNTIGIKQKLISPYVYVGLQKVETELNINRYTTVVSKVIMRYYKIDLKDGSKEQRHVNARGMFIKLMHDKGFPVTDIAKTYGMNRITCWHALLRINKYLSYDNVKGDYFYPEIVEDFNNIKKALKVKLHGG